MDLRELPVVLALWIAVVLMAVHARLSQHAPEGPGTLDPIYQPAFDLREPFPTR